MPDRLVHLQHHLVGQQQEIHLSRRAVRRREELQRLLRQACAAADEARALDLLVAALLRVIEAACLRVARLVRRHAHVRHDEVKALPQLAAGVGEIDALLVDELDHRLALDDAAVELRALTFRSEQVMQGAAPGRLGERRALVLAARRAHARRLVAHHALALGRLGPARRAIERLLESRGGEVARGAIAIAPFGDGREHGAAVDREPRRLERVLAHGENFARLVMQTQRPARPSAARESYERYPVAWRAIIAVRWRA